MNKINKVIEESNKEFMESFVEMHSMHGHDMHNRPILYDKKDNDIKEIQSFISQRDQKILSAIEEEVEASKKEVRNKENSIKISDTGSVVYYYLSKIQELLKSAKEQIK